MKYTVNAFKRQSLIKMATKTCLLKSIDNRHAPINLTENEMFIGRSPITEIQDAFCSRKQVSVCADFTKNCVRLIQLGTNSSALNGFVLEPNKTYEAYHSDRIELILNKYIYEIIFDPIPSIDRKTQNETRNDIENSEPLIECSIQKKKKNEVKPVAQKRSAEMAETTLKMTTTIDNDRVTKKPKNDIDLMPAKIGWEHIDDGLLLIYTSKGVLSRNKIASYDLDGTIIKTKSGNVFAKHMDDWQIGYPEVPGKLKKLIEQKYKIVFFTNQGGIGKGNVDIADFKKKVERIVAKLNVPIQVFVATGKGQYRKPLPGMWNLLRDHKNSELDIDMINSFYVGDAAGRPERKEMKRKKDHSLADRYMALNVGISFFTPEEHFQHAKAEKWTVPDFDQKAPFPNSLLEPSDAKLTSGKLEVIILVGMPGSGKSHFAATHLECQNYHVINRDTLKKWQNCVETLKYCLERQTSAVIDNTNGDKLSRKRYIDVAKSFKVDCRCFVMNTNLRHAKHNIAFRDMTDKNHAPINDMVLFRYQKAFQEPKIHEGFKEIVKVNFLPKFEQKDHETLYKTYLID